ncbi:hypothetical protein [Nonomuraea bangladeshensis]|uniref:hypothetical protein n=1 Tax=Nonomuraea bangladeshensis TaxID=404385 RepID=UPI003C2BFE7B
MADERGVQLSADDLVPISTWLLRQAEWLRHHPAGGEAVQEVGDAVQGVRMVIDRPPDRLYAGPCDVCQMPLYARPGDAEVPCRRCLAEDGERLVYDISARRKWMLAQIENLLGSSSYVAMVATGVGVKVSSSAVRMWVKRGKLAPRKYAPPLKPDGPPRPLYRVGDVVSVARGAIVAA